MHFKYLIAGLLLCLCFDIKAQNFISKEHCYLTEFIYNPAVAGSDENITALFSFKRNWTGIKNAPSTAMLNVYTKASNLGLSTSKKFNKRVVSKIGIGLGLYSDKNGPLGTNGFQLAYSYHLPLFEETKLSMGLSAKLMQYGLNQDVFVMYDPYDPIVGEGRITRYMLNFNFGFLVYHKKYHVGISSTNIGDFNDWYNEFYYQENIRTLYLHGGYKFTFPNAVFEPTLLLRSIKNEKKMDMILKFIYKDKIRTAIGWSSPCFLSANIALKWKEIIFGYVFEFSTAPLYKYSYGNHMAYIGYNL